MGGRHQRRASEKRNGDPTPRVLQRGSPPPPPAPTSSGTPKPRVLQRGSRRLSAPDFTAGRLSGLPRSQIGASRPVARVTRESVPGRVHFGAAAFPGERKQGDHLCAVPRGEGRPPAAVPNAAVAAEAEPSRAAERPRHEAQLLPATEGL